MNQLDLTILIPALNEEKTIAICIEKGKKFLEENNINGEILVINNGSTDNTEEISKSLGARTETVEERGYGVAIREGIRLAKGKYTIMIDADDSYNLLEVLPIYEKLLEGYQLVIGNRFKGNMEKGAMKFLHRYIGTPLISWIARKKYDISIGDFNCGLRGFDTEKMLEIGCNSKGMELATEMIIKARKQNIKMAEVPINFYKDKRNGKSHLRTVRDGIRHFKIIIKKM